MRYSRFYCLKKIVLLSVLLCVGGCATVNVPHVGSVGYHLEDDEKRIINRSNEMIEAVDASDLLYKNLELEKYLNRIAQGLISEGLSLAPGIHFQVKVLKDPTLNAIAFANGAIYVHTGLLAASSNEAQIAILLGHEMTHVLHRHTLKQFRSAQNSSAFWGSFGLTLDVVSGGLGSVIGQLSFLSSSSGFSQSLEYEADEGGFEFAQKKGYDSTEAINLFEQMATFTKDEEIKEPFFFSSHPKLLERIKKFQELNASKPSTSKTLKIEPENYLNLTRQLRLDNIDMCFERGYYKTAERNIDFYISLYPDDVQGMLRKAELFRRRQDPPPKKKKRQKDEDYIKALDVYEKILFLHPDLPSAWLGKARILQKLSRTEDAKKSFQKYLELEPGSAERLYIEQFLNTLATERAS